MAQEEVLRMVAAARDQASGPLRKVENALRGVGKGGGDASKQLRENLKTVHEQLRKVADVAKEGVAPAIEEIGVSSLTAVGAVAALVAGLKGFVDQGTDVAAFGRKVMLTTNTIRGLEGVADKFHVDPTAIRQGEQTFTDAMFEVRRRRGDLFAHLLSQRRDIAEELAATPETTQGNEKALKIYLKLLEDLKRVHNEPLARRFSKEVFGTDAFVDLLRKGNAGLDEARDKFLALSGAMDTDAGEKWVSNWSDFKAALEGVRNAVGNDLLPDLTEMAKKAQDFFSENHIKIGHDIADSVRQIGSALRDIKDLTTDPLGFLKNLGKPGSALYLDKDHDKGFFDWLRRKSWNAYYRPDMARTPIGGGGDSGFADAWKTGPAAAGVGKAASIIQGLRDRGLDAEHAAIIAGNIEQESGFDPTRPNVAEGGIGLLQWRKERRAALQDLARRRGTLETDLATQLDFLVNELHETRSGRDFLGLKDARAANGVLHQFIGYGDDSEAKRFGNAGRLLPLAERSQPGSILAAAGKSNSLGGGAAVVTGSASLDVNVKAPPGTSVRADAKGLFDRVSVNRGLSLSAPLSSE